MRPTHTAVEMRPNLGLSLRPGVETGKLADNP
jgi:hypothetical protein